MIDVIKALIPILNTALMCVILNLINARKSRRIRQFPLVVFSFISMIIAIPVIIKNYDRIEKIIGFASPLLHSSLVIVNMLLMVGFFVIKLILCPVCASVFKNRRVLEVFSFGLYKYDEEYDEWFLKNTWKNFRKFFFWIVGGTILAAGLYLGLTWVRGPESRIWFIIFPCSAVIVMNEIYCFINGQTKEEFEHCIFGDDSEARRISNYYKIRGIFERILPSPLLSAHTGCEFLRTDTAADLIKKLGESDDADDKIVSEYFDLNGRYKVADVDCVQATSDMIHHKNVVFFNPFYRDLGMYITLPMIKSLLAGKKCIVLCGRMNTAPDVKEWLSETLREYSHMRSLWRVNFLSDKDPECEVGILTFTQLYDKKVINANRGFFSQTDFVMIIEPSLMLNTSQVALSIMAEEMNVDGKIPVYCICDRYVDGLIDTMSHLLRTEITDVVAAPVPRCSYTAMSWDADGDFCRQQFFDKQTRYLGNGIELAAIAVKNQVPSVTWYSERKSPIRDIKWITGQYYPTICRYINQPSQQKSLYEKIKFVPTLWSSAKTKEQFLIAEDEFCNMFSVMRAYLSRGSNHVFVNVLSENYLLRDYMRFNKQMFISNPNAIPSFVPDYAKTERNTILKLIIMMTLKPMTEDEIIKELHLIGIETNDAYGVMLSLLKKYTYADETIFTVESIRASIDEFTTKSISVYSVSDEEFEKYFSASLKNAYYILEDEKDEEGYIDAKLFSHVAQTVLPGQFVTYDGKYYQVKYVSPQSGVVLRRASDQFDSRKYYRQVRSYSLDFAANFEVVSNKKIVDVEFAEIRADFSVVTTGYIEMSDSHNLKTARLIDFSEDPGVDNYTREYRNKSMLRIKLPDSDDNICFTVCLLLSEIFKSVFPDGWQYLAVVSKRPKDIAEDVDGMLNYVVYPAEGDIEPGYIYIIEDSDVDLGLLNAIEKNFMRFMEIIADFLDWHFGKIVEPEPEVLPPPEISADENKEEEKKNFAARWLDRIKRRFGGKEKEKGDIESPEKTEEVAQETSGISAEPADSTAKSEIELNDADVEEVETGLNQIENIASSSEDNIEIVSKDESTHQDQEQEPAPEQEPVQEQESTQEQEPVQEQEPTQEPKPEQEQEQEREQEQEQEQPISSVSSEPEGVDGEPETATPESPDTDDVDVLDEEPQSQTGCSDEDLSEPVEKTRYQRECFLKFGYEEIDERIHIDELREYLCARGWCNNSLTLARKCDITAKNQLDVETENHCDFCSLPLTGVSYEQLNDGRIRCNDCSASAITTLADFKELFYRCLGLMEDFFDIRFRVPIGVKTTDAREVAKCAGAVFRPSKDVAARVLGFAQKKNGKYNLVIENGSPRRAAIDTTVHELTHIWQYLNWNDNDVLRIYKMGNRACTQRARAIVYEGMAMWASIQYLYQIGETFYAAEQEALAESRQDVYGVGFRLYRERYPFVKDSSILKYTPFSYFPTLEPSAVIEAARLMCTKKECTC